MPARRFLDQMNIGQTLRLDTNGFSQFQHYHITRDDVGELTIVADPGHTKPVRIDADQLETFLNTPMDGWDNLYKSLGGY